MLDSVGEVGIDLLDDRGADAEHLAHRVERPVEVLLQHFLRSGLGVCERESEWESVSECVSE